MKSCESSSLRSMDVIASESIKILVRSDFIQQLCRFSADDRRLIMRVLSRHQIKPETDPGEENMILSSLFFRSDSV